MIVNGSDDMEQLVDVYSSLFAQITHRNDETAPPCHGNTQYPKILLQKVRKSIKLHPRIFTNM